MVFSSVCALIPTWELILTCGSLCPEEGVGTSQGPTCCCWASLSPAQQGWHHHRALGRGWATFPDGFGAPSQASCEQQHPACLCPLTACCPSSLDREMRSVCPGTFSLCHQMFFPLPMVCWAASAQGFRGTSPASLPCFQPKQSARCCSQRSPGNQGVPRAYLQRDQEL